ncbi:WD repeat-containing protein 26 [Smittium mucronatum]|uniref:WD repeat-containing protein 26 n=1 Tax=Smittium mucronatum TaxID=133383 RepID=A0A1R0GR23_9FUNG|nr:WD repeat-containing protein 26 [Smittium mucronatum]
MSSGINPKSLFEPQGEQSSILHSKIPSSSEIDDIIPHSSKIHQLSGEDSYPNKRLRTSFQAPVVNSFEMKTETTELSDSSFAKPESVKGSRAIIRSPKFKEVETVRVILQQLWDLGLRDSFNKLQEESGYLMEEPSVYDFKESIIRGEWEKAIQLIDLLPVKSKNKRQLIVFKIKRQEYLEALEAKRIKTALTILQSELSVLSSDSAEISLLSRLMMFSDPEKFRNMISWFGNVEETRQELVDSLHDHFSSDLMLGPQRLQTLFSQAMEYQKNKCQYHVSDENLSLYNDHICKKKLYFKEDYKFSLREHSDEVWYVAFSNNGEFLASGSKDKKIIIWETTNFKPLHIMTGHEDAISCLSWSPDDKTLVSSGNDMKLRIWNPQTGSCLMTISKHTEHVTAVKWTPDGQHFISGGLDKLLLMWDKFGEVVHEWDSPRVHDLAVGSNGENILVADNEDSILLFDYKSKSPIKIFKESSSIMSIYYAKDCKHFLVNTVQDQLNLWDIESNSIIMTYHGYKYGKCVSRCGLGGPNESIVYCGSPDGVVNLWNRHSGVSMQVLYGHSRGVNCCSYFYNKNKRQFLATASDDHSINIF